MQTCSKFSFKEFGQGMKYVVLHVLSIVLAQSRLLWKDKCILGLLSLSMRCFRRNFGFHIEVMVLFS